MNRRPARSAQGVASWWLIVLVPLVSQLIGDPGRLNADTKYDLTADPARLMRAALSSWDETLQGGWVLQQHAGYLWPTGPFFLITEWLPDWVQQRLWVAALMIVAGLGARFAARQLGLAAGAATVAGLVYQLSPYPVPYLARTSAMLLPWAVAGWLLAAAILATRRPPARWLAVAALLLATAGGVNSTALVMITPLPLLWFWWARRTGDISGARAVGLALATGTTAVTVSAWWLVSAWIGARHGPNLLTFSETLRDVSSTATGPEVLRLSGYWLTHVVESDGTPTTDAGRLLTGSPLVVGATALVAVVGLAGAYAGRWAHRGFVAATGLVAVVLAVGVHPIDDPSPLGRLALDTLPDSALTALRSSTRALPLLGLVLAVGAGRVVSRLRPQPALLVAGAGLLAVAAPWVSLGRAVDPALERPATPPASWDPLLAAVDGAERVLVIPGSEFSTFTWGHTQDPPWTSTVPVITRELLPLGSPDRMDLLLALDDALQEGTADPDTIAGLARQLGADRVWVAADIDHARYGTVALAADALVGAEGLTPLEIVDGVGGVYAIDGGPRSAAPGSEVELWGSGRGTLTAASAGLVDGDTAIWRAGSAPEGLPVIVTDGDRDSTRQWRTSQGTRSAAGDPADRRRDGTAEVTRPDPVRTTVRLGDDPTATVTASTYGDPFTFRPEVRPAMALDGDPDTAWRVDDPTVQPAITLTGGIARLVPIAVAAEGAVTALRVEAMARSGPFTTVLTADDTGAFPSLDLPEETTTVTVTIDAVTPGARSVGLAELLDEPMVEHLVVPPAPAGSTIVLERWRLGRDLPGRRDPEPVLNRIVTLDVDTTLTVEVQLSGPGSDCRAGVLAIDGLDLPIDPTTGTPCDGAPVVLGPGEHRVTSTADLVVLRPVDPTPSTATCCTLVLPRAHAIGWRVALDGQVLDTVPLAGGAIAVRVEPGVTADGLVTEWTPDRAQRAALAVSGLAAILALLVIVIDPGAVPGRSGRARPGTMLDVLSPVPRRLLRAALTGGVVAVTVDPLAGVVTAVAVAVVPRPEWAALAGIAGGLGLVAVEVLLDRPAHGIGWPAHFGALHVPVTALVVACCVWLMTAPADEIDGGGR
ncbi:MAG: hypothetical protein RIR49_1971 [Actinomycetota bacterium]